MEWNNWTPFKRWGEKKKPNWLLLCFIVLHRKRYNFSRNCLVSTRLLLWFLRVNLRCVLFSHHGRLANEAAELLHRLMIVLPNQCLECNVGGTTIASSFRIVVYYCFSPHRELGAIVVSADSDSSSSLITTRLSHTSLNWPAVVKDWDQRLVVLETRSFSNICPVKDLWSK